jgi:hypothetical protein
MKEPAVNAVIVAALLADTALVTALGGNYVFRSGARRAAQIPSVEWEFVAGQESENLESLTFQFTIWARGYDQYATIAARVAAVLRPDKGKGSKTLGGIPMLISVPTWNPGTPDPEPGVLQRSLDITFAPAKESV